MICGNCSGVFLIQPLLSHWLLLHIGNSCKPNVLIVLTSAFKWYGILQTYCFNLCVPHGNCPLTSYALLNKCNQRQLSPDCLCMASVVVKGITSKKTSGSAKESHQIMWRYSYHSSKVHLLSDNLASFLSACLHLVWTLCQKLWNCCQS
jgi:hypothetical protein